MSVGTSSPLQEELISKNRNVMNSKSNGLDLEKMEFQCQAKGIGWGQNRYSFL